MALLGKRLAVSIPDTVLEEKASLRDKTAKIGAIARACSIYGVDVIEVFRDPKGAGEGGVLRKVLEYIETPQYLRRRIYPLDETLKYAGMLPPLRIPSHKPKIPLERLEIGEVREGVVVDGWNVDMGLDATARLREKAAPGRRMTVRVTSLKPLQAEPVPKEKAGEYWGYMVETKSAAEVTSDPRFRVRVATSRLGTPVSEAWARMETSIGGSPGVKLIFGSPSRGLFEMFGAGLSKRVDFVVNLYPEQQVETVRTEEAIFSGLGLVSMLAAKKA